MMNETRRLAIEQLERVSKNLGVIGETIDYTEIAIEALEQEHNLDKIRTEIEQTYINITYQENKDRQASWGLRKALEIIDKYKAESEE